jgi:propanol-preferring alcohol dehydrogenase
MKAMRIHAARAPLRLDEVAKRDPAPIEVLVQVRACGICRTDLHIVNGELAGACYPITPGHEVVGNIVAAGEGADHWKENDRVGIPWLGWTCGACEHCTSGRENLCGQARFTGYHLPGGYADYVLVDERFCLPIPPRYADAEAAPLLCAGLIGFRCYLKCGDAKNLGLYGFGAAAHILAQVARVDGRQVFAFTRPGDSAGQAFAVQCGAHWAGDSTAPSPEPLDAAIIFAPAGDLVPQALKMTRKGGRVICGGIHMSDIPSFPYALLWGERRIESVANLTREDGARFMDKARSIFLKTQVTTYPLDQANAALDELRHGRFSGAAVLIP